MSIDFWINVGVLAAIYGIFSLGLQLNVGFTGLANFGQAGFMAIGAYASAILTQKMGLPFAVALPFGVSFFALCGRSMANDRPALSSLLNWLFCFRRT